ncbi:MAG: helix-turn-helix domain-containing protein [Thermaerobacter sp.]|nr:helix-turn-helix domain-containing protein [Thermaerobacter sp.]
MKLEEVSTTPERRFCEQCRREVPCRVAKRPEIFRVFGREPVEIRVRIRVCCECGAHLYDAVLDEANFRRAYNIYRRRHQIPFPSRIRALRRRLGLSPEGFARLLGCDAVAVRRYEAGAVPLPEHAAKLRRLAGATPPPS